MSRTPSGSLKTQLLADGTRAFHLRFSAEGRREHETLHERRACSCGCEGSWSERTAGIELENILAKIRAGVWRKRRDPSPSTPATEVPTFHVYASAWLESKVTGVLGDRPIDTNTHNDYRWRLARHLLPFFGEYRLDEIDAKLCVAFMAHKLREAAELRAATAAGAVLRDSNGRRQRPLGPASIRKLVDCLAAILDEPVEDEQIDRNPARGRRMRVKVPKPARTFLEMDELVALTDAAGEQDARTVHGTTNSRRSPNATAATVAARWARGARPSDIAVELGLSKATVSYHLRRLGAEGPATYLGRRAILATLAAPAPGSASSATSASGSCACTPQRVRTSAYRTPRPRPASAKYSSAPTWSTNSSITSTTCAVPAARPRPTTTCSLAPRGGRMSRQRAGEIVSEAAQLASENLTQRSLPALPNTTPHTLRRTYISIALLANRFDVLWVMNQVGHADSKMTMDVYAQLQQRVDREHGRAFDALVRQARDRLYGVPDTPNQRAIGNGIGNELEMASPSDSEPPAGEQRKRPC